MVAPSLGRPGMAEVGDQPSTPDLPVLAWPSVTRPLACSFRAACLTTGPARWRRSDLQQSSPPCGGISRRSMRHERSTLEGPGARVRSLYVPMQSTWLAQARVVRCWPANFRAKTTTRKPHTYRRRWLQRHSLRVHAPCIIELTPLVLELGGGCPIAMTSCEISEQLDDSRLRNHPRRSGRQPLKMHHLIRNSTSTRAP